MFLQKTPFYKDTRDWRWNFFKTLETKPKKYWDNFELDIDKHVDKTYILHLPHRTDKVEALKTNLQKIKTKNSTLLDSVTWWEGFFGKTEWDKNIHDPNYSFYYCWNLDPDPMLHENLGRVPSTQELKDLNIECSLAESNIALGHTSILQDIVDTGAKAALILEDDILFTIGFSWLIEKMFNQLPPDWDIFYVSYAPCMYGFESEPYSEDLVKINSGVWWLSGVFISQRAAKKLIDNLPVTGPVDVWINYHMNDLNVYGSKYNCIGQNTNSSSDNTHSYKYAIHNIDVVLDGVVNKNKPKRDI